MKELNLISNDSNSKEVDDTCKSILDKISELKQKNFKDAELYKEINENTNELSKMLAAKNKIE